jgi:hypothetical protein
MESPASLLPAHEPGRQKIRLTGEIVGTFQHEGATVARIAVRSCWIELEAWALASTHLGETVILEAGLEADFHTLHAENHHQP